MKIVLENVNTKEQKVIEEENMITNGFLELIKSRGPLGGSILGKLLDGSGDHVYSSTLDLFKGVMLFDTALDEDVNHLYETDSEVVACGSDNAYTGSNQKMGSYNKTESGKTEDGYKFVWDFSTNQGNGEIACACLTTIDGGRIAYGFDNLYSDCNSHISDFSALRENNANISHGKSFEDYASVSPHNCSYYDGARNRIFMIKNAHNIESYTRAKLFVESLLVTKKVTFVEARYPFTNISALDDFSSYIQRTTTSYKMGSTSTVQTTTTVKEYKSSDTLSEIEVTMPSELESFIVNAYLDTSKDYKWFLTVSFDEGYCYISFFPPKSKSSCTWDESDDLYVWKISMVDFSSSYFKVRNTTGQILTYTENYPRLLDITGASYTMPILVTNDFTYVFVGTSLYAIDNIDNTIVKKIKGINGEDIDFSNSRANITYYYRQNRNMYFAVSSTTSFFNVNPRTGIAKKVYLSLDSTQRNYARGIKNIFGTNLVCMPYFESISSTCNSGFTITMLPNLLMTINNLEAPVTKTNSETMKVIYTITQAENA